MLNDTLLRLLEVSIATSFLILPLCLASRRINRRYGAKWKYYIWLLLAVRLMIPINLPAVNGFSIMPDLSSRQQVHTQEQPIQPQAHIGSQPDTVLSQSQEQEQEQSVSEPPYSIDGTEEIMDAQPAAIVNVTDIAAIVWCVGFCVFSTYQLCVYYAFRRGIFVDGRECENNSIHEFVVSTSHAIGLRRTMPVIVNRKVNSPMILGIFRPVLVIPREDYSFAEFNMIVRHELTHCKRHDIAFKVLLTAVNALHWFNPFVYLMVREANADIELCCDADVLRNADSVQRKAYADSILTSMEREKGFVPVSTCFSHGSIHKMKERLENIVNNEKRRSGIVLLAATVVLSVLLGIFVSSGKMGKTAASAMVYPLLEECSYNGNGELISRTEYEYSPEGYLLYERTWSYYYVRDFAGGENYSPEYNSSYLFGETDVSTYRYDKAGRLVEEYRGFHFDDGSKGLHYRKYTATYAYDDKGRRIRTKEIIKDYTVNAPLKGFNDDNMTQDSEDITTSEAVITDNPETGGWTSLDTFTFSGDNACYNGETVKMEYDAEGKLLSRTKTKPYSDESKAVYTARYEYDDKGRPVSAHIQTLLDGTEIAYSSITVEYNKNSHIVRKTIDADSDIIDGSFKFEIRCSYDDSGRLIRRQRGFDGGAGCDETVVYGEDGSAVKEFIHTGWDEEQDWLQNIETTYSDPDENGDYQTLSMRVMNGKHKDDVFRKVIRAYGEAIPSGVKYGTSGLRADQERVSPVQHNFDLGIANEYLYYDTVDTDDLYDMF